MNIYIAGAFGERARLRARAAELEALGHTITADWLYLPDDVPYETDDLGEWAVRALEQVRTCDLFIYDTLGESRGGRDTELGFACALGKPVFIVGPSAGRSLFVLAREGAAARAPRSFLSREVFTDWTHLLLTVAAWQRPSNPRRVSGGIG